MKAGLRVAIIGNLAGVANEILIGLREAGIDADLYIYQSEKANTFDDLQGQTGVLAEWVNFLDPVPVRADGLLSRIRQKISRTMYVMGIVCRLHGYDLIHAYTGSLNYSFLTYLAFVKFRLNKYLAFATGSDIREVARNTEDKTGRRMLDFFKNARKVFLLNADMVGFKQEIGLQKASFFPFAVNELKHAPMQTSKPEIYKGKLLCFMMSNLDFGITDSSTNRNSMKHNDRFFHALAEFTKTDRNIHAVVLDRGSDREVAKKLVRELGIENYVTFHRPMTELERIEHLNMADVVLDQFHLGAFGLGALEALSVGKPLITYFREDCIEDTYGCDLPIMNARTSEEITRRLFEARDPEFRHSLSARARAWILEHHSRKVVIDRLIHEYQCCTGAR